MIRFESDYLEGGHEAILKKLAETNRLQTPGYGEDEYCESARKHILRECGAPDAAVHFLVGGTQANTVMLASILRPHQAALSARTGHIAGHETGAIEATGHKVLVLDEQDGKISGECVKKAYDEHWADEAHEHIPQPGLVYISQTTETGTLYSKAELETLGSTCRSIGLPLVLDGARLGYGLAAPDNDVTLKDIAKQCDMFTIGGTKVGALFGEAVVITNPVLAKDFRYIMKQRGGMLAKGRLLGLQFEALFENGLYYEIAGHALKLAMRIKDALLAAGAEFCYPPVTNQLFPVLPSGAIETLTRKYSFTPCGPIPDKDAAVIRICTSWATREEDVRQLISDISSMKLSV